MALDKYTTMTARGTQLGSELNSLASGSYTAASAAYDNSTNLDRYGIAELAVTFGSAPTADSVVQLYIAIAPDGTNYEDGGSSVRPNPQNFVGHFVVRATTNAQRLVSGRFELPPGKFKFIAYNATGQAFPSTGSTVKLFTFNREVA